MATNLMLKTFENISLNQKAVHGVHLPVLSDARNDYDTVKTPTIPAGSELIGDFVCNSGMYALAEIGGVLHRVLIPLEDLHRIYFGELDARSLGSLMVGASAAQKRRAAKAVKAMAEPVGDW